LIGGVSSDLPLTLPPQPFAAVSERFMMIELAAIVRKSGSEPNISAAILVNPAEKIPPKARQHVKLQARTHLHGTARRLIWGGHASTPG
jgi:hypothetical protein